MFRACSFAVTSVHGNTTFGSLTLRVFAARLRVEVPAVAGDRWVVSGVPMKFLYVCYAAFGFAVARWMFKREPMSVSDPVPQFRTSGLL